MCGLRAVPVILLFCSNAKESSMIFTRSEELLHFHKPTFIGLDVQYGLYQILSLSMGTHDLRFLRHVFCKSSCFFDIINTINDDIISGVFLSVFEPCNDFMWFCGSDSSLLLSKLQRNVVKCKNSEITDIFCSVYKF